MGSYLDSAGLTQVWGKLKDKIDAAKEVKSLSITEYDKLEQKEENIVYYVKNKNNTVSIYLNGVKLNDEHIDFIYLHCYIDYTIEEFITIANNENYFVLYEGYPTNTKKTISDSIFKVGKVTILTIAVTDKNNTSIVSDITFAIKTSSNTNVNILPINNKSNFKFNYFEFKMSSGALNIRRWFYPTPDWNEDNNKLASFIKNKPSLLSDFSIKTFKNDKSTSTIGDPIITTDSYIDIYNLNPSYLSNTPFTTTLYVGRYNKRDSFVYAVGAYGESYCFSISVDFSTKSSTGRIPCISITQLSGSYTDVQKFTKLRIVLKNNNSFYVRLYYTNPKATDYIKILGIGQGRCTDIDVITDSANDNVKYYDYDLTTGFRTWENTELRLDSHKDYTDVTNLSLSDYNSLTTKDNKTFYITETFEATEAPEVVVTQGEEVKNPDRLEITTNNEDVILSIQGEAYPVEIVPLNNNFNNFEVTIEEPIIASDGSINDFNITIHPITETSSTITAAALIENIKGSVHVTINHPSLELS